MNLRALLILPNMYAAKKDSVFRFLPYDDDVEPIATEEERQMYEEEVSIEEQEEEELLSRFSGDIAINLWSMSALFVSTFYYEYPCC